MRSTRTVLITVAAAAAGLLAVSAAQADGLLLSTGPAGDAGFGGYGHSGFSDFTNIVDVQFPGSDLTLTEDLSDLSLVLAHDALWIDLRGSFDGTVLSATEQSNLTAFIATGRRVAFFGENNAGWADWNASFLSLVGGSSTANSPATDGHAPAVLTHPLTAGLNSEDSEQTFHHDSAGIAIGGTPLFDVNVATLWGPSLNVLTVLDMNVFFDSRFNTHPENEQFLENVALWLSNSSATPAPEPASVLLFGAGLAGLGLARRQRRTGRPNR